MPKTSRREVVFGGAAAAVWPAFRGPNGAGVDTGSRALPEALIPGGKDEVWAVPMLPGASSPVLTAERIYLTAWEGTSLLTLALDRATGRILWRRPLPAARSETRHKLNNAASPTPAVDDAGRVYVFFPDFGLAAYGPDGNELWKRSMGPFTNLHGMAASPVRAAESTRLILSCDQDVDSFVAAFDTRSGREVWRKARPAVVHGFATPTLLGDDQVVIPGSYLVTAYAARTGEELWSVRGLTWQIKNSAIADSATGTLYVTGWAPGADAGQSQPLPPFEKAAGEIDANTNGRLEAGELNPSVYKHGGSWRAIDLNEDGAIDPREWGFYRARRAARNVTMAIRPGDARGDLTDTHVLWRNEKFVPQVSSPLLYQGVLYIIKDGGIFTSLDPATGAIHKTARIPAAIDSYYASPIAGGGKLYLASEKGKVTVLRAGAQWESLHTQDFDDPIFASPALDGQGRIYLRTSAKLYCFAAKP